MNPIEYALRAVARDLDRRERRWALVGGFAVSTRASPRFTHDIDIAALVDDDQAAENLIHSLIADKYALVGSVEHDNGRLATARLQYDVAGIGILVDLLFASSGIEAEVVGQAERLEVVDGLSLPVASAGHLIALKLLARDDTTRPQDLADLRALAAVATPVDIADARDATRLITEREYARGRDLSTALTELLSQP